MARAASLRQIHNNPIQSASHFGGEDGRLVRDMYRFQVKSPEESKGKDDIYKLITTVPGDKVYRPS
jgi:branched-chain amino acid transport system substrate-binding protein